MKIYEGKWYTPLDFESIHWLFLMWIWIGAGMLLNILPLGYLGLIAGAISIICAIRGD